MKKTISVLLLLCMFVSLFSGMAFAADDPQEADVAVQEAEESNVKSVFNSNLYVEPNAAAGLVSKVAVKFDAIGATGTLYLPGQADASKLCFSWDDTGITVSRNGVAYESGTAPVAPAGSSVTFKITKGLAFAFVTVKTVQGSSDVKAMFLELDEKLGTIDAMNSDKIHETSCYGKVLFDGQNKPISIKGRGNSTWSAEKKPYNITVYEKDDYANKAKAEFIPGVKAKKWSLLANHLDNSLMRNKIAMDLAKELGIGLDARFVDLWMNGEYLGNYLMTPKNDYKAPDGGYVLENDNYLDNEDPQFQIPGMYEIGKPINDDGYYNRMTVKDIGDDAISTAEIEAYFDEAWAAVEDFSSENYQNYFDLDSWAKMFLMYEVSKTYDCFAGSLLMHRDGLTENDKLIAGPAWDYDVSFGRTLHKFLVGIAEPMQLNAEGWYNDSIGLIAVDQPISMLQELGKHASFMQHVAKIYNENRAAFEGITANVDRQKAILRDSALMNNVLWGTHHLCAEYLISPTGMRVLGTGKYMLNYQITVDWDAYVANLREFAAKRVLWLSDHLYAADAPAGAITKTLSNGELVLTVALTAGNNSNTYQWQRSADGSVWENVQGATAAQLKLKAGDSAQYHCVVANTGAVICTNHGGKVPTYTTTILVAPEAATEQPGSEPAPDPADSGKTGLCKFFEDVDRSVKSWYAKAVDWAVNKGITTGISDTLFAPMKVCTRAQVVTFLWRAAGKPAPTSTVNPFKDVQKGAYYYDAVLWAVEKGITTGVTADTFEPDAPCTRGQVVTFLWRANGKPAAGGGANPFSDVPAGSWFKDAVLWANSRNITNGTSATTFSPDSSCTRAHVVTFLYRNAEGK